VSQPPCDLLLKGGRVLDPANGIDHLADVAVADDRIAQVAPAIDPASAAAVVDVSGHYVIPGLIDIHMHAYHTREPDGLSVMADHHSFRAGVTTVVDTGTAGARHFLHFKRTVIDTARTRILAFINIVQSGMLGEFEQDVGEMDPELAASIVVAYPQACVGIKTAHYWPTRPYDERHPPWAAVDRAIAAGEICRRPVMVDFWPRPERPYPDLLLKKMRPGDIHTHVFAQQFPILDAEQRPQEYLYAARERGVLFDLGHGAASFWFRQAEPAIQNGFLPDTLSTDLHVKNVNGPVFDMLTTVSKMLNLGMTLPEVIARATAAPARAIGRPELGTLTPGAEADIAVLSVREGTFGYTDCGRARKTGRLKLECVLTLRAGKIVYDMQGRSMPEWPDAPPDYWTLK
jgi:dihydroorotase